MGNTSRKLIAATLFIASIAMSGCTKRAITTNGDQTLPGLTQPIRLSSEDAEAAEPAMASSSDGSVFVAWVNHRKTDADVMLARFGSDGKLANPPVRVNTEPGVATAWRGDPPTIAIAPDQTVFVGWTGREKSSSANATNILLSASHDHGLTFGAPAKVNDDTKPGDHGMHSLVVSKDGHIYLAWLDERNLAATPMPDMKMQMKSSGQHVESNREVFIATSTDGGRTFSKNQSVASEVCPCCKTSLAVNSEGRLFVSWRQVLPGDFRHIAVASSNDQAKTFSKPTIVSDDQWMLAGCPVSGGSLSAGDDGVLRVLWYSEGKNGQTGLYWSESSDNGETFGPRRLLAAGTTRGTPVLLAAGKSVNAIWQTFEANSGQIMFAPLKDGASPIKVAGTGDLPAAVASGEKLFLAYVVRGATRQEIWFVSGDRKLEGG